MTGAEQLNEFNSTDLLDTLYASDSIPAIAPRIYILTAVAARVTRPDSPELYLFAR